MFGGAISDSCSRRSRVRREERTGAVCFGAGTNRRLFARAFLPAEMSYRPGLPGLKLSAASVRCQTMNPRRGVAADQGELRAWRYSKQTACCEDDALCCGDFGRRARLAGGAEF